MKKNRSFVMCLAVAGMMVAPVFAADTLVTSIRDASGTPIRPGVWHAGLTECRNYAEANGIPLMAVWSNEGCGHCK
ncbi:MAG: hypothetical protein FWF84_01660, partial [Kiritimatiellaeota bacterium]|nr:hypothetical protein [Kiritimatiellota bacterium]